MAANFQEIANQFVPFYYQTFDTNREGLATLYRDPSMLTYESASVLGVAAIVDKLKVRLILRRALGPGGRAVAQSSLYAALASRPITPRSKRPC